MVLILLFDFFLDFVDLFLDRADFFVFFDLLKVELLFGHLTLELFLFFRVEVFLDDLGFVFFIFLDLYFLSPFLVDLVLFLFDNDGFLFFFKVLVLINEF